MRAHLRCIMATEADGGEECHRKAIHCCTIDWSHTLTKYTPAHIILRHQSGEKQGVLSLR